MFQTSLVVALLFSSLIVATPAPQGSTEVKTIPGLGEPCGFIWGTTPCSNPYFKCCYLYPDAGYCLPVCPKKYIP